MLKALNLFKRLPNNKYKVKQTNLRRKQYNEN